MAWKYKDLLKDMYEYILYNLFGHDFFRIHIIFSKSYILKVFRKCLVSYFLDKMISCLEQKSHIFVIIKINCKNVLLKILTCVVFGVHLIVLLPPSTTN
jgi:hypothetical protein